MTSQLRQLLHAYTSRRSPWGPPWWIYGVAFGAANLVRQVVIIVTTAEIPQAIRVASWVATALVVIIVINSVAVALQRRGDAAPRDKRGRSTRSGRYAAAMSTVRSQTDRQPTPTRQTTRPSRWLTPSLGRRERKR